MYRQSVLAAAVSLIACLTAPRPAEAELRALLVGVSDYDDSLPIKDLAGPPNDVRYLARVLAARGAVDVTILSDAVDGAGAPTRSEILGGLDALTRRARTGDLVMVHFSGHGTQQLDHNGDENDGLDEVFLPLDAGRAAPGSGIIANALVDDEIGAAVDAIRATGADVWLVMDSCNSGTGMRAAGGPSAVARFVAPEVFGIEPGFKAEPPGSAPLETRPDADLPGSYVAFYAAQSSELAYEVRLGEGEAAQSYGLFTSRLASRLEDGGALSYRQLFQAVLTDMADSPGASAARVQTPLWEGPLIDAAALGGSGTVGIRQFSVAGGRVQAGLLHGFAEGTMVALVADASAADDQVLGYAQLYDVAPDHAQLRPVGADCLPRSDALCDATDPPETLARFARLVARPVDQVLRLAPPRDTASGLPLAADAPLALALADAVASVNAAGLLKVTFDADDYRVEISATDDALWFGGAAAIGQTPVGLRWQPGEVPLEKLLTRIARAEQIAANLGSASGDSSILNRNPVQLSATVASVHAADLYPPDRYGSIFEECGAALSNPENPAQPLTSGARLKPCDQVHIAAQATRDDGYDVNRVQIDAQYCVTVRHERLDGRQPASGAITEDITMCNDRCPGAAQPGGLERLYLVVTKAQAGQEPMNLTGLLETCEDTGARAVSDTAAGAFLAEMTGGGLGTRGLRDRAAPKTVWVETHFWQNVPRAEVYRAAGLDTGN